MKKLIIVCCFFSFACFEISAQECKVLLTEIAGTYVGKCKDGFAHGKGTATGIDTPAAQALNEPQTITNGTNVSKTVIGTTLSLRATGVNTLFGSQTALYATLNVIGRDSGARVQVPVIINKTTT